MNKDTSVIPVGDYCYKMKGFVKDPKSKFGYVLNTKVCPYFSKKNYGGVEQPYCELLEEGGIDNKTNDEDFNKLVEFFGSEEAVWKGLPLDLLWDQVKECEENMEEKFILFWDGPFSQWHPSEFEIDGVEYNCCEQWMMAAKAKMFNDMDALNKIMKSSNPREQKKIGREVKGFNAEAWDEVSRDVVYRGNYAKFTQNPKLKQVLLETAGSTLVEASPYDKIWGDWSRRRISKGS